MMHRSAELPQGKRSFSAFSVKDLKEYGNEYP